MGFFAALRMTPLAASQTIHLRIKSPTSGKFDRKWGTLLVSVRTFNFLDYSSWRPPMKSARRLTWCSWHQLCRPSTIFSVAHGSQ